MPDDRLLASPMAAELLALFGECRQSLFVAAPFINEFGIATLISAVKTDPARVSVKVLTSVKVQSLRLRE